MLTPLTYIHVGNDEIANKNEKKQQSIHFLCSLLLANQNIFSRVNQRPSEKN